MSAGLLGNFTLWKAALIFAAGGFASFVNVFAGGGSLITLPLLIALGLSPSAAQGTNKVGVFLGTLSSSAGFYRRRTVPVTPLKPLLPGALLGSIAGSLFAVEIPDAVYRFILSGVLIFVLVIIVVRPKAGKRVSQANGSSAVHAVRTRDSLRTVLLFIVSFGTGIYAGIVQAGMGFLLTAVISMAYTGDLVEVTALKAFISVAVTAVSLVVFFLYGEVHLLFGLILAAGFAVGGFIGSRAAVKRGEPLIRVILVVTVVAMVLKVTGILDLLL